MSCPSESIRLLYAEGELEAEERRELDTHLVGCRACRERVVALRDEARLLGSVLREEPATSPSSALAAAAPEPGVAYGLPLTIAAVSAALAAASALVEARLPGSWDLLHPRRLKGATEMAFDMIFLLRENAPGLIELALAVGSVAAVSALLSFAVSSAGRRLLDRTALLAAAVLVAPLAAPPADAFEVHRDEELRIDSDARVDESVVVSADRVDIDGVIDGDLIAGAERVTLRGKVTGSLYVFARELEISGEVGGSVHVIAERVRVEGSVGGSLFAAAEDFALAGAGRAAGDVNLIAESAVLGGEVGRDLHAVGDRLDLRGRVGRDVRGFRIRELELRDEARIAGDVIVTLEDEREVVPSPGARIGGELRAEYSPRAHRHYLSHYKSWRFYLGHALYFVAAFVFGLVLYQFAPQVFSGSVVTGGDLARTLMLGFVALVVTPLAIVAVALTVVGLPVAVSLLFVYLASLYTADLVVGAWIGRLWWPPEDDSTLAFGKSMGLGLGILTLVAMVPFLGPAVGVVAMLAGLGLLANQARDYLVR